MPPNDPTSNSELNFPDHANVIAPPPVIYLCAVIVGLILHFVWPVAIFSAKTTWMGVTLVGLSLTLGFWGRNQFKKADTSIRPDQSTTAIIRTGPYGFSRNPLYLSIAILQAGIGVWANSLWILIMLVPALVVISRWVIAREERYLERKFGEEYLNYKASVRRWV